MGKLRIINTKYKTSFYVYDTDLIVIPSNPTMSAYSNDIDYIYELMGKNRLNRFCKRIYGNKRLKVGEIRVTPGFNIKQDIMFMRLPMNESDSSNKELLQIIENMITIIDENEYREIMILDLNLLTYGYDKDTQKEINELIEKSIQNLDLKITLINNNLNFD